MKRGLWTLSLLGSGKQTEAVTHSDAKSVFFWREVLKGTSKRLGDSGQSQGEQLPKNGAEFESRYWQHITKQISELL